MPTLSPSDALSVIGFFLTLVGLLGSFFYIHLSDWLREVIALETKWETNESGDLDEQRTARGQCRYEVEHLGNWTTLWTSLVTSAFVIFIFVLSLLLWLYQPDKNLAWQYIGLAGLAFMLVYLGMTLFILIYGYRKARTMRAEIIRYFDDNPR
jgi:hypothetical protein